MRLGLTSKILWPMVISGIAISLGVSWYVSRVTKVEAVRTTLESAQSLANQIRATRGYYTGTVVKQVKGAGGMVTHEYAENPGAIPLPATMVHELTETLNEKEGYTIRLYSLYPFPWRKEGGARDDFEREAIEGLTQNPDQPFWTEGDYKGEHSLRFATADIMVAEGCVSCHNSHPETPKDDWKLGDVRGAIEVIIPLDKAFAVAGTNARNLGGVIAGGILVLVGLIAYITFKLFKPLKQITHVAGRIAEGDINQQIDHIKQQDEVGKLSVAFGEMTGALQKKAAVAEEIANGNLDVEVEIASEHDVLAKAMDTMKDRVKGTVAAVNDLIGSAKAGELDERVDTGDVAGDFKVLREGINEMLDAIVDPISEGSAVLATAAGKDLTKRVKGNYKGQLLELKNNINTAVGNLDEALSQVAEAAGQVNSASDQISSGSQNLAEGANEQASSLEEVSSSLEEMSSMTKQNADNANEAKNLAAGARESADKGNDVMTGMSGAIEKIKSSSDETAKIVKTIDEIAFQTNLLALNAAVEAARAGEAGKGFAVVAEEVRNLAQRSAEAAKSTADMIEDSVKNADSGVRITEEVAKLLIEIVEGTGKVNNLIGEIAAASNEQSQGIEQVNTAVAQMNKVTQQNAANSEESASAAEELNGQSQELSAMVKSFALSRAVTEQRTDAKHRVATRHNTHLKEEVLKTLEHGREKATKAEPQTGAKPEDVVPLDETEFADF